MAKREYIHRTTCSFPGCQETRSISFPTRKEYNEAMQKPYYQSYTCGYHSKYDENVSVEQTQRRVEITYVCKRVWMSTSYVKFWCADGDQNMKEREIKQNGLKAYAKDFPEGTVLKTITVIEISVPKNAPKEHDWYAEYFFRGQHSFISNVYLISDKFPVVKGGLLEALRHRNRWMATDVKSYTYYWADHKNETGFWIAVKQEVDPLGRWKVQTLCRVADEQETELLITIDHKMLQLLFSEPKG